MDKTRFYCSKAGPLRYHISVHTVKVLRIPHDLLSGNCVIVPDNEILMLTFWEAKEQ